MTSNKKTSVYLLIVVTIVILVVGVFVLLRVSSDSDDTTNDSDVNFSQEKENTTDTKLTSPVPGNSIDEMIVNKDDSTIEAVVTYVEGRFDPSILGPVAPGTTVKFFNESSSTIQIASDDHPSHQDLPEFDSGSLAPGEEYEFTFNEIGSWSFHDHFQPNVTGQVTVTDL